MALTRICWVLGAVVTTVTTSAALAAPPLVPHRAVYDIALVPEKSKGVSRAGGRIAFEFSGNACDGYSLNFRQVTQIDDGEGRSKLMDMRSATWEEGEGKAFRFSLRNLVDNRTTQHADGEAARGRDGGVSVALKQPRPIRIDLPSEPVFPTEHTRRLIDAAQSGARSLALPVFDGSDGGEKFFDTTAIIGAAVDPASDQRLEPAMHAAGFAGEKRWPVAISYFDAEHTGDRTPVYVMAFDLFDNGIYSNIRFDFDDFSLSARMSQFERLKEEGCRK